MAIFGKKLNKRAAGSRLEALVQELQGVMNNKQIGSASQARAAFSMESLTDNQVSDLAAAHDELSTSLESIASHMGFAKDFTVAQKEAAIAAGIIAGDMRGFFAQKVQRETVSTESRGVVMVQAEDALDGRSFSMEAYDERENRNAAVYSIAYNMQAARQDEFGETFYPTIVVSPDNVGFAITVRLMMVYNELTRNVSGALDQYNKQNIIRAIANPTILKNEQTRIVPVVRTQSEAVFVDAADVAPFATNLEGVSITTAPLKCAVKLSLLGVSQTDAMLANGMQDITDDIDPMINLTALYVKVGADVIQVNTSNLPLSAFNYSVQNNYRVMQLNFDTTSVLLNKDRKNVDGSALVDLKAVVDNQWIVRLALTATGSVNIETAETVVFGNYVAVHSIQDAAGNLLDLTTGAAKTFADAVAAGKIIGYDLQAYRTNMNRRQRGQLVDTTFYTQLYNVALRSPITALHPVTVDGQTDASDLASLITATRIRTSNAAVTSLISAANLLREYVDVKDASNTIPDVLGVGRFYVKPTFFYESVVMSDIVDSITSHQRAADIQAALVSKIRDYAYRMYRDSEYKAAADALAGGMAPTPTVIIGTDPVIARYLNVVGDLRTLGGEFDVRIVSTLDQRVAGKIFVTFGVFDENRNVAPNPLNFGNMAWSPELTVVLPISRGGQVSKETAVQPRFLHIVNLPVMAVLEVAGIEDVTNKLPVFMHQIP